MTEAAERKARARVRKAQAEFERAQSRRDKASASRSFEQAQQDGLTVRDIAEETGLGFDRVAENSSRPLFHGFR